MAMAFVPNRRNRELGITVQELTPELAEQLDLDGQKGVLVTAVDPRGPAAKAKPLPVKRGDLIQEIGKKPVENMETYHRALVGTNLEKGVLLLIRNKEGTTYTFVSPS